MKNGHRTTTSLRFAVVVTWIAFVWLASEATGHDSQQWRHHLERAESFAVDGDFTAAFDEYQAAIVAANAPEDRSETRIALADFLSSTTEGSTPAELREVESLYRRSIEELEQPATNPASENTKRLISVARNNLAVLLLEQDRPEEALDLLADPVVLQAPADFHASLLHNRGLAMENLGRVSSALDAFLAAVDADPSYRPAVESSIRLVLKLGDDPGQSQYVVNTVEQFLTVGELAAAEVLLIRSLASPRPSHSLLSSLTAFLSSARVGVQEFRERWYPLLEGKAEPEARTLNAIYDPLTDVVSRFIDLPGAEVWSSNDRFRLAVLLEMVGDYAEFTGHVRAAAARYSLALDVEPNRLETISRLANLLGHFKSELDQDGDKLNAVAKSLERHLDESRKGNLEDADALMVLALAFGEQHGPMARVRNYLRRSEDLRRELGAPESPLLQRRLAEAEESLDRVAKARNRYLKVAVLYKDLDRLDDALEMRIAASRLSAQVDQGQVDYTDIPGFVNGQLSGRTFTSDRAPLSDAKVMLSRGDLNPETQSDFKGRFSFIDLQPGDYHLTVSREGFSTLEVKKVEIKMASRAYFPILLYPEIQDTITVTVETPLLDSRKISSGSTVTQVELAKIPSARDPWVVLQTVPGVQTDRINVGGNESGQQSQYTGPGSTGADAVWSVDGVVITDMAAIGSSPTYYNFDAFEEMNAATGGSDASLATGGVTLNMVTKRGTNEWRGSGRYILADGAWQSQLDVAKVDFGVDFDGVDGPTEAQETFKQGNRIVRIADWGAEVGGPIVKDKLWIWANFGHNDINILTIGDVSDFTQLEDYGGKFNAQVSPSNSLVVFYNYGSKVKLGRNAGPTRPQQTTWDDLGSADIYKMEDTHVFSSSFFVTGMASYVGSSFELTPLGGIDGPSPLLNRNYIWQNNYIPYDTVRPQEQGKIDGNYFFNSGSLSHDLKFGFGYRQVDLRSQSLFPGGGVRLDSLLSQGSPFPVFQVSRDANNDLQTEYTSAYVQDTLTVGNLTANIGLRYDQQNGNVNSVELPGVPGFEALPDGTPLMPAATTPSLHQGFVWERVVPRLGLTYAMGAERKTLLRASFARFASQLGQDLTGLSAAGPQESYAYFFYEDANNDGFVTPDETISFLGTNGYDPFARASTNLVDPGFEAPLTNEIILVLEHAILPEFAIGATFTFRKLYNLTEAERLVEENGVVRPHVRSDYVLRRQVEVLLPDGSEFTVPVWALRDGLGDVGGAYYTNGDREQRYKGLSLFFNRRLSNRWMLRGNVTLQDWRHGIPEHEREDPNIYVGGANDPGGRVLQGSGTGSGSKGGIYINADWSYSFTGMYQVKPDRNWGFNISAAINGRSGYPIPYYISEPNVFPTQTATDLQATEHADDFKARDVHIMDLRIEKDFDVGDSFNFTIGIEVFNVLNNNATLQRRNLLGISNSDHVFEVISPRTLRIGIRFRFD